MKARKPGETTRKTMANGKARPEKSERACATYIVHAEVRHMIWLESKGSGTPNVQSTK